jgi:hypothetical protein
MRPCTSAERTPRTDMPIRPKRLNHSNEFLVIVAITDLLG